MCEAKLRLCDDALQGRCRGISSVATDGGQHFGGDPTLEDLRLQQLGGEDEGVKARLVDDGLVWVSLNTVTNRYGILFPNWVVICHPSFIFLIDMCFQSIHSKCPAAARVGFIPVLPTADKIQSKYPAAARVGINPTPTWMYATDVLLSAVCREINPNVAKRNFRKIKHLGMVSGVCNHR